MSIPIALSPREEILWSSVVAEAEAVNVEFTTRAPFSVKDAERQRSPRAQAGSEILLGPGPET
jgi:hypothetical protein